MKTKTKTMSKTYKLKSLSSLRTMTVQASCVSRKNAPFLEDDVAQL